MGLLYPFPATPEETDFVSLSLEGGQTKSIMLKTYGLPYIFWAYAAAAMTVVFFLWLAVHDSLSKLYDMGDPVDQWLVRALQVLLVVLPLTTLCFFFYEKRLTRQGNKLKIQQRVFGIPYSNREITLAADEPFAVDHFLDAPNVARMKAGPEAVGFQNKGYFTLWVRNTDGKKFLLDRHSRKADLVALKGLLELAR